MCSAVSDYCYFLVEGDWRGAARAKGKGGMKRKGGRMKGRESGGLERGGRKGRGAREWERKMHEVHEGLRGKRERERERERERGGGGGREGWGERERGGGGREGGGDREGEEKRVDEESEGDERERLGEVVGGEGDDFVYGDYLY